GPEEEVDANHLALWIAATDRWRQQQASADVGCCNPKDGELHVPGSQQIAGKKIRDMQSVEALRVGSIMRGCAANKCLRKEQQNNNHKVFQSCSLAIRHESGQHLRMDVAVVVALPSEKIELSEYEENRASTTEQGDETQGAPQDGVPRCRVPR